MSVAARRWAFLVSGAVNGALLWFFHNHFWYPPDDGNYAHVAQRLLGGEILHLQVQDVHPGYINVVNAAALGLFGLDLVSLRYPLVLVSFLQACLVFGLFTPRGPWVAATAAVTTTALGLIQFLNPTAHWYCLFLAVVIVGALRWLPRKGGARLIAVGFLVGTLALFRQLSGGLVAIGVLAYLLIEAGGAARGRGVVLERAVISVMATGLAFYLWSATDVVGWLLFGMWPLAVLGWLWSNAGSSNREVLRIVGWLSLGGVVATLPLTLYHLLHGSIGSWLDDTVWSAVGLTRLDFLRLSLYGSLTAGGLHQAVSAGSIREALNGVYWFALPLLAALNGMLVLRGLERRQSAEPGSQALPVLAVFYAVVSVHYQVSVYLYYTVGLSAAGLLWMTSGGSAPLKYVSVPLALLLSCVGVYFHAGQPVSRGPTGILTGERVALAREDGLPRCRLRIEADDQARYGELVRLIQREVRPDETIFAFPSNAELYFLSGRRNPFRFYNTALGVRNDDDLTKVKQTLRDRPPRLITFDPHDKYNTAFSSEIIKAVGERYVFLGRVSGLEVYRWPSRLPGR